MFPKNIYAQVDECNLVPCLCTGTCKRIDPPGGCTGPNDCPGGCCKGGQCSSNCAPSCSATAPSNLSIAQTAVVTINTVTWIKGTGGDEHILLVDNKKADVDGLCNAGEQGSGTGQCLKVIRNAVSPTTVKGLSVGTVYYYKVVNFKALSCRESTATKAGLSSCTVAPSAVTVLVGGTRNITVSPLNDSSEIIRVDFSSSNPGVASVSPASDNKGTSYSTTVTGVSTGPPPPTATITSKVYLTGPTLACSATADVTVISSGPWWQVKDGDVTTNGDLISKVPSGQFFGIAGAGGYPGIPSYGSTSLTSSNVSPTGWRAQSVSTSTKIYDYNFFENQIPIDITTNYLEPVQSSDLSGATPDLNGFEWYKYTGPLALDLNSLNLGSRKVILLVKNADLNIRGNISLTDGFFGAFVNGKTIVNSAVTSLEGIYLSDLSFETGVGTSALSVRGSVATYGGVSLQRDLTDNRAPAEFFEYAPDQILLFPKNLSTRKISWKEVSP